MLELENIANEYQNYAYDASEHIASNLTNLKRLQRLDESNLAIHSFILPEVIKLLNKAILNRLSVDMLFEKNYWSWGFVGLYYSNFFLSQALNRLKGDFFVFIPLFGKSKGRKNIQRVSSVFTLIDTANKYADSHAGELLKFKENYNFLLANSTKYSRFLYSISTLNESEIRNNINYRLDFYNELMSKSFKSGLNFQECHLLYKSISNGTNKTQTVCDEFTLLRINNDRFGLIFNILNRISEKNSNFEEPYSKLLSNITSEIKYNTNYKILRVLKNYMDDKKNFHTVSTHLEKQIERLWL